MALELQIYSPKPENKFPTIKWNNEELKAEIAKAVEDYQNLVVTPETEKDCKDTRAKLNKLRTAIEDTRKEMKRRVNEPYAIFEKQVKEVEAPIDQAMQNLDKQLAEIKVMRQEAKRKQIKEAYEKGIAPEWLKLEQIWDEKWLNVSVSMNDIIKSIDEKISHINANLGVIANLPEFAFEAEELYKQTLDFKGAVEKAKQMSDIQKRKAAEAARKATEEASKAQEQAKQEQPEKVLPKEEQNGAVEATKQPLNGVEQEQPKKFTFTFQTTLTAAQAAALGNFCKEQGITLTRIS